MAVLVLIATAACRKAVQEDEAAKPLVEVKLAPATLADVSTTVTAPATIYARERANISSAITAPIRVLRAHKGDRVAKGQLLAELDDRDLRAQRGEALAAVRQAQVLRDRRAQLFEQGAIPQRDLLGIETELAQSRARLEKVDAQIHFAELRSPFAGSIVEQFLYAGDMVKPDTPVFTVVDMSQGIARAQVPEVEIGAVRLGQRAVFSAEAMGDATVEGKVSVINQAVDPARRTVEVWAALPNESGLLRDGVFGRLAILTDKQPQRVVVPRTAVQLVEGSNKGRVMVVDAQKIAHRREVETRGSVGDRVAVTGVQAGENVVVEAGYGLPDGTTVRVTTKEAAGEAAK